MSKYKINDFRIMTEEEKNEYIQQYLQLDGIVLNRNDFRNDPSSRALVKLILNCLWGKFIERDNHFQKSYSVFYYHGEKKQCM